MRKNDSDEIARLRAENESLYKRNTELEAKLADARAAAGKSRDEDEVMQMWHRRGRSERLFAARYYSRFLVGRVKSTSLWAVYVRLLTYFRRYRFISSAFRILTLVIAWIETGAVFFVSFSALLVILPIMLVLAVLTLMLALLRGRGANKKYAAVTSGKKIYVLFGTRGQMKKGSSGFLRGNAESFASEGAVCFVVSPFFFGKKGLGGRGAYVTGRNESENVYILRKNYFFLFRRKVLGKSGRQNQIIYIY